MQKIFGSYEMKLLKMERVWKINNLDGCRYEKLDGLGKTLVFNEGIIVELEP